MALNQALMASGHGYLSVNYRRRGTGSLGRKKRGRVIVVEDADSLREGIVKNLDHSGFLVSSAEDGQSALELISNSPGPYFALVVDLDMPRKRGDELIAELESSHITFDVYVLMSGHPADHQAIRDLRARETRVPLRFLPKPFEPDDLVTLLDSIQSEQSKGKRL